MRKTLAAIIAVAALLAAWIPIQANASTGGDLTFAVGSYVEAARGGTVTVPITVSNNPGFSAVGLVITYDSNVLVITGVSALVSAMPLNSQFALTTNPGTQWIRFANTNNTDWSGNGVIANITFNVNQNATDGPSFIGLSFIGAPDGTPSSTGGSAISDVVMFSGSVDISGPPQPTPQPSPTPTQQPAPAPSPQPTPQTQSQQSTQPQSPPSPTPQPRPIEEGTAGASNTPSGAGSLAITPPPDDAEPGFGPVPQTSVPDLAWLAALLCASLVISAALWLNILRRKYKMK